MFVVANDKDGNAVCKGDLIIFVGKSNIVESGRIYEVIDVDSSPWGIKIETEKGKVWIANGSALKVDCKLCRWNCKGERACSLFIPKTTTDSAQKEPILSGEIYGRSILSGIFHRIKNNGEIMDAMLYTHNNSVDSSNYTRYEG